MQQSENQRVRQSYHKKLKCNSKPTTQETNQNSKGKPIVNKQQAFKTTTSIETINNKINPQTKHINHVNMPSENIKPSKPNKIIKPIKQPSIL